jgi:hypothetical protein
VFKEGGNIEEQRRKRNRAFKITNASEDKNKRDGETIQNRTWNGAARQKSIEARRKGLIRQTID